MKRTPGFMSISKPSLTGGMTAFLLASALCACGNKGSLVLPTDPPPEQATEVPTAAATDAGAEADPLPADQVDAPATALPTDATVPVEPDPTDPEQGDTSDDDPPGDR